MLEVTTPDVWPPTIVPETAIDSVSVPVPPVRLSPVVSVSVVEVPVSCAVNVSSVEAPVKLEPVSRPVVSELTPDSHNPLF